MVFGVGFAPQFSLALTYIDDHVPKTATAFMMSIPTAFFAIGPVAGFPMSNSPIVVVDIVFGKWPH